jgi:hypothetical protein
MGTRHLSKALVGLVTTAGLLGLLGLPASAVPATVTSGTIEMYNSDNELIETVDLDPTGGSGGVSCNTALTSSIGMSGTATSGTWTASVDTDSAITIGATHFRAVLTGSLSGSYGTSTLSGSGGAVATIRRTTGAGSCTYLTTAGTCTVTATAVNVAGTHTVSSPPTIQSGATATIDGDNAFGGDLGFEMDVTGNAVDCGVLIGLIDGYVKIVDLGVEA